jgi:hypothetical protein
LKAKYLSCNIDRLDPTVALAVIEAPAALSGAPQSVMTELHDRAIRAQHGEAVDQLLELENAIRIADEANEAGREAVMHDLEIYDRAKFDELAAPFENKVAPVRLRKSRDAQGNEKIIVVEPGYPESKTSRVRDARPEDLANGKEYKSFEEYQADRAAFVA